MKLGRAVTALLAFALAGTGIGLPIKPDTYIPSLKQHVSSLEQRALINDADLAIFKRLTERAQKEHPHGVIGSRLVTAVGLVSFLDAFWIEENE